jgi:peptidoglycan/LPS O-acetylase OafA/YrhL
VSQLFQAGELRSARIESLRALAAIAVLESHTFAIRYGFQPISWAGDQRKFWLAGSYGVWVFFALTGYLLFRPFAAEMLDGAPSIDLARYALNRTVRILPLYLFVLTFLMIVDLHGGSWDLWWHFLLFAENFSNHTVTHVDSPMWSLVVEVHFYILLPFLALALRKLARGSLARSLAAVLGLGVASLVARRLNSPTSPFALSIWQYSLPMTFCFFVPGMTLALLSTATGRRALLQRLPARLASANVWLAASVPCWVLGVLSYTAKGRAAICIATFLVLGACVLPLRASPLLRLLEWRPLALIGVASYSLYLWHVPIARSLFLHYLDAFGTVPPGWLFFLITLGAATAVAAVSYRLIEAPFLKLRRQWQQGRARAAKPAVSPATEMPAS